MPCYAHVAPSARLFPPNCFRGIAFPSGFKVWEIPAVGPPPPRMTGRIARRFATFARPPHLPTSTFECVDILGVYIPPGLEGAAMLKGFMAAAGDLDTERKQRMF